MDTRTQGFLQRTLRTFGSLFKSIVHMSQKSASQKKSASQQPAEDISGMQTKTSTISVDKQRKQSPDMVNNCMHASAKYSVAVDRQTIGQAGNDNNSTSCYTIQKDEEIEPQFFEGPARVVTVKDGSKNYHAILLSERMVDEFVEVKKYIGILHQAEKEHGEAKFDVTISKCRLKKGKQLHEVSKDSEERARLEAEIETQEHVLSKETQRKQKLKKMLIIQQGNLKFCQDVFQNIFGRAFEAANILRPSKIGVFEPKITPRGSIVSNESKSTLPSQELLFQRMAFQDIERANQNLLIAEEYFDRKEFDYQQNLEEYEAAFRQGKTKTSRTVFDVLALETLRYRTTDLIEAEEDLESALARGRALDIMANHLDQESGFVDDVDDGYPASEVAADEAEFDGTFIEFWNEEVSESGDPENPDPDGEPDEWEAESVGMSDSISCVDYTRNRRRIDRWRTMCEE